MTISPQTARIGFIGLGIMGRPMAGHLVNAGYPVTVHNRSRAAVDALVAAGAADGGSPASVARAADVIVLMLPDTPDVEQVLFGPQGVADMTRPGQIVIDMSTISPGATRDFAARLREKGVQMLDAPVSGGQKGAAEATLSIMVGGEQAVFDACLPLFQTMGKNVVRIGDVGAGQVCKACNQIVVAVTIQAVAEALTLARKLEVDAAKVRQALLGGFAQSRILDLHGQRMLDGNFQPGFRVQLHHKDLNIALSAGGAAGVPLPATAVVQQLFTALRGTGDGDLDHSALAKLEAALSGLA